MDRGSTDLSLPDDGGLDPREPSPSPGAEREPQPLSPGQRSLWFQSRLAPASAAYNIAAAGRLAGSVDRALLRRAFQVLLDRHAVLRTTFESTPDGPVATVHDGVEIAWTEEGACGWSPELLARRIHEAAFAPFDLAHGPL